MLCLGLERSHMMSLSGFGQNCAMGEVNATRSSQTNLRTEQQQQSRQFTEQNDADIQTSVSFDKSLTKTMVAVTFSTIPEYLRNSELYKTFQAGENEVSRDHMEKDILVPAQCYKMDEFVNSQEDLVHLCHTLRYWGVAELPPSIILAAFSDVELEWDEIVNEFSAELSYLTNLSNIRKLPRARRIEASISMGSLELVKFLHEQQECEFPGGIICCSAAARSGHLHLLRYFHEKQCHWDQNTTKSAAMMGHLNCLQYAYEHSCPLHNESTMYAADAGHLNCLQYAHEYDCLWDEDTTKYAAVHGHLSCLQYAHEHGCPLDEDTTKYAAEAGHLSCLQYAHEHGCPWDGDTTKYAALNSDFGCLNSFSWDEASTSCASDFLHLG